MQAAWVLAILGIVIVLLISERLRPDVVAMLALAALLLLHILPPKQALSGFSNPATVTVACMFLLSAGLQATGFVSWVGDLVARLGQLSERRLLALLAVTIAPISAFVNNTAAVAVFLPIALKACRSNRISPSRILMPMAFIAILGGTCTLIGTSTNILVTTMAAERGQRPFTMFEFSHVGLIFLAVGAAYLLGTGYRRLPERIAPEDLTQAYSLGDYLSELLVGEGSPLVGKTLEECQLRSRLGLEVLAIVRDGTYRGTLVAGDDARLRGGDVLLAKGRPESLLGVGKSAGLDVRPGRHPDAAVLRSPDSALLEAVIYPNSSLEGRSLEEVDFRTTYGGTVLALRRGAQNIQEEIGRLRLAAGDELLILTPRERMERWRRPKDFVILQELELPVLRPGQAALAALIVAGVVIGAAVGLFPVVVGALCGAVLMIVSGCLPARQVYASVEWRVIVLLAGVIPLGLALETSGAVDLLVRGMLSLAGQESPRLLLVGFVLLAYLLTGFMSNAATAALMVPLAITAAATLGVDSRPFLVAIMFAASAAFYTPVGYQTNLLVYGPGGYRFTDYTRVGGPLNLLYVALSPLLIPLLFPF